MLPAGALVGRILHKFNSLTFVQTWAILEHLYIQACSIIM